MSEILKTEGKNISGELRDILELIDNLEVKLINVNKKNEDKISMYKMMMENLILQYHETCLKTFEKKQ
jgi:hypothetical protein